jgi:hypothetical protein
MKWLSLSSLLLKSRRCKDHITWLHAFQTLTTPKVMNLGIKNQRIKAKPNDPLWNTLKKKYSAITLKPFVLINEQTNLNSEF